MLTYVPKSKKISVLSRPFLIIIIIIISNYIKVRPKASGAGLVCLTDQYFQRQRLPYTCRIKTVKSVCYRERGRLRGKGSGEKVSFKTRMEDPVRHADYRFRSRVRAWRWRRAL